MNKLNMYFWIANTKIHILLLHKTFDDVANICGN